MPYSFCLLTATWLAAAPQVPTTQGQPGPVLSRPLTTSPTLTPVPVQAPEEPARPWRFGDRIRSLFSRRTPDTPTQTEPPLAQVSNQQPVAGSQPAVVPQPVPGPGNEQYPLSGSEVEKVGHEKDHSWITGKLFRTGDRWVLRYGAPYEVDRFGGAVLLLQHPELAKMKAGDLICVHGHALQGDRRAHSLGAVYQIQSISLIERPNGK